MDVQEPPLKSAKSLIDELDNGQEVSRSSTGVDRSRHSNDQETRSIDAATSHIVGVASEAIKAMQESLVLQKDKIADLLKASRDRKWSKDVVSAQEHDTFRIEITFVAWFFGMAT